jgi:hypothetical protein
MEPVVAERVTMAPEGTANGVKVFPALSVRWMVAQWVRGQPVDPSTQNVSAELAVTERTATAGVGAVVGAVEPPDAGNDVDGPAA